MPPKRLSTTGLVAGLFETSSGVEGGLTPAAPEPQNQPVRSSLYAIARTRDGGLLELPLDLIRLGDHQPRHHFDEERIAELAESIRAYGVIEPILVTPDVGDEGYLLVAGERRIRAARRAGRTTVPALVRDQLGPVEILVLSLTENLQREDLSPIERTEGIVRLQEATGETLVQVAQRLGYTKARVSQLLGYRRLPPKIYNAFGDKRITEKQAQALLRLAEHGQEYQEALFEACTDHQLRDAEARRLAQRMLARMPSKPGEIVADFLKERGEPRPRTPHRGEGRLASFIATLRRIDTQLADLSAQVYRLGSTSRLAANDVSPSEGQAVNEALAGIKARVRDIEASLKTLQPRR